MLCKKSDRLKLIYTIFKKLSINKNLSESVPNVKCKAIGFNSLWLKLIPSARLSRSVVPTVITPRSMGIFVEYTRQKRSVQSATTPSGVKNSNVVTESATGARKSGFLQKPPALCAERLSKGQPIGGLETPLGDTTPKLHLFNNKKNSKNSRLLHARMLLHLWREVTPKSI